MVSEALFTYHGDSARPRESTRWGIASAVETIHVSKPEVVAPSRASDSSWNGQARSVTVLASKTGWVSQKR